MFKKVLSLDYYFDGEVRTVYNFTNLKRQIDENAVKHIGLLSSKRSRHRPRKLGDVGSSPTGSDIFHVFSSIFVNIIEFDVLRNYVGRKLEEKKQFITFGRVLTFLRVC